MSSKFFEKLVTKVSEAEQATIVEYRQIAAQVADGREPNTDRVAIVLDKLSKTPADLEKAVSLLAQRRGWKTQIDALAGLDAEYEANKVLLTEAEKILTDARERFEAVVLPIASRNRQILQAISDGSEANRQLRQTCQDVAALQHIAELSKRAKELRRQAGERSQLADNCEPAITGNSQTLTNYIARNHPREHVIGMRETVERQRAIRDEHRYAAAELNGQADAIAAEQQKAELALLEP